MDRSSTRKLLLIVCGGKGGVGKTAVCRALIDASIEAFGDVVIPVESDVAVNDMQRYFPDRKLVKFSESPISRGSADEVLEFELDGITNPIVTVNLPGSTWDEYKTWLEELGFTGSERSNLIEDYEILQIFVTDGTRGSIEMLEKSILELDNRPRHILIRNHGRLTSGGGWSPLEEDKNLQGILCEAKIPVFDFPALVGDTMYAVESNGIPFGNFARPPESSEYQAIAAVMKKGHHQRVVVFRRKYIESFREMFGWMESEGIALPKPVGKPKELVTAASKSTACVPE